MCLYFSWLRLRKYSSPWSPVTSGSYFAQFPSWAVNICIIIDLHEKSFFQNFQLNLTFGYVCLCVLLCSIDCRVVDDNLSKNLLSFYKGKVSALYTPFHYLEESFKWVQKYEILKKFSERPPYGIYKYAFKFDSSKLRPSWASGNVLILNSIDIYWGKVQIKTRCPQPFIFQYLYVVFLIPDTKLKIFNCSEQGLILTKSLDLFFPAFQYRCVCVWYSQLQLRMFTFTFLDSHLS